MQIRFAALQFFAQRVNCGSTWHQSGVNFCVQAIRPRRSATFGGKRVLDAALSPIFAAKLRIALLISLAVQDLSGWICHCAEPVFRYWLASPKVVSYCQSERLKSPGVGLSGPGLRKSYRRRRSWYRRRLRIQRALIAFGMGALLVFACWQNLTRLRALTGIRAARMLPESFWARANFREDPRWMAAQAGLSQISVNTPAVYAYSVIPGGVQSVHQLREIAARDYVVRRHFARFDFNRARLERARQRRLVYLSYRIRDRIYWTHKKVLLSAGELVLTDGNIAARARCGNQISEEAQPDLSDEEPSENTWDTPVAELSPIERGLPFRSSLARPMFPGVSPRTPSPPRLFAGGFYFPYVPFDSAVSFCDDKHHKINDGNEQKKCHDKPRHPAVPEPGSLLLIGSGLTAVAWRWRKKGSSGEV